MAKVKVKIGAITKEIEKGALKHFLAAGWKEIKGEIKEKKELAENETDSEKITTT